VGGAERTVAKNPRTFIKKFGGDGRHWRGERFRKKCEKTKRFKKSATRKSSELRSSETLEICGTGHGGR